MDIDFAVENIKDIRKKINNGIREQHVNQKLVHEISEHIKGNNSYIGKRLCSEFEQEFNSKITDIKLSGGKRCDRFDLEIKVDNHWKKTRG